MFPHYRLYYIQSRSVFKGFFFILFFFILILSWVHILVTIFRYTLITLSERVAGPLFQVNHLKSQSFFILIPVRGNLGRPP